MKLRQPIRKKYNRLLNYYAPMNMTYERALLKVQRIAANTFGDETPKRLDTKDGQYLSLFAAVIADTVATAKQAFSSFQP